ncbi:hypothetical protein [Pseudomonas sp. GM48]|uniref:hypothetical protein n=1 Tax=Pseudomonas sp. GM48 TaxID=1144330 RepID=UPI0012FBD3C9|nr:hypothetical protein [Pseudomonas sp. GM48]
MILIAVTCEVVSTIFPSMHASSFFINKVAVRLSFSHWRCGVYGLAFAPPDTSSAPLFFSPQWRVATVSVDESGEGRSRALLCTWKKSRCSKPQGFQVPDASDVFEAKLCVSTPHVTSRFQSAATTRRT